MFWLMQPVIGAEPAVSGAVDTSEVWFEVHMNDRIRDKASVRLIPALREVRTMSADPLPGAVFATLREL